MGKPVATTTWAIKQRNINLWESDADVERDVQLSRVNCGGGLTLWNAEGIWDSTDGRIKFFQTEEEKQVEA